MIFAALEARAPNNTKGSFEIKATYTHIKFKSLHFL
jgi:hypothetical protein